MSPRPRFDKLDPERRKRIILIAADEFAAHGFAQASLNAILREAGMSKGQLYYYFEDKADLFATTCRFFHELGQEGAVIDPEQLERDNFWSGYHKMVQQMFDLARRYPVWVALGRAFMELPREHWFEGEMGAFVQEHLDSLTAFVRRGRELGLVRDDIPVEILAELWFGTSEVLERWILSRWETVDEDERAQLEQLFFETPRRLLEPGAPPSTDTRGEPT